MLQQTKVAYPPAENTRKDEQGKKDKAAEQPEPPLAREIAEEEHKARVEKAAAEEGAAQEAEAPGSKPAALPADSTGQSEAGSSKKPTLARDVAEERRGEHDTRSDEAVKEAIKKKAQSKMDEFDARLFSKKKAA